MQWTFAQIESKDLGKREELFQIDEIEIRGLKKVEKEAILERISVKNGIILDNYLLKSDLNKIYSMRYFESVEAFEETRGNKKILVFSVKEKPIVTKIDFSGNTDISDEDLKGQIKTKAFTILDTNLIKADINSLLKHYEDKGYYLASVDYELKKINDENLSLEFKIKEFDKVKVKKITFLGNQSFDDEELKGFLQTQEDSLFSALSGSGSFKEANFQTDIEKVKYFYRTKGHLQINVGTPEITVSEDKKWVFITIRLVEGPKFSINRITFQGELLFTDSEMREKLLMKEDQIYSEDNLRLDIKTLTEMYQDEGFAFANVIRNLDFVPGENKVNVEFSFEKGKLAYFGKFIVKGNNRSRDKVIRRELLIKEGEKFHGTNLRMSRENVERLGFFENDSIIFNTVSPKDKDDILDVEISVKEKSTGQISAGAGYSTASGGFFQASIAQANFRGLGQNLSFSVNISESSKNFRINFTEPYFLDTKWSLGGGVFVSENESSDSFKEKKKGFNVQVGYPIFAFTHLYTTYKLEDTKLKEANDPTIDITVENGLASGVQVNLVHDKRNDRSDPRKGYYLSYLTEYTGLGGDKKWIKNEADVRAYYPVWEDLVLRTRYFAGRIDEVNGQRIPRTELFSLGGARNLRGYSYEGVGPTTTRVVDNRTVVYNTGGIFSTFATLEFQHPLSREAGLKWVVFFDAGHAGSMNDVKIFSNYGFGFRWFSPIGVLRFEFGYPLTNGAKNEGSQFHFDIGQLF